MFFLLTIPLIAVSVYVTYMFSSDIMKNTMKMEFSQVLAQNIKVSVCSIVLSFVSAYMTKRFHPIKITYFFLSIFTVCLPFLPYLYTERLTQSSLFFTQIVTFCPTLTAFGVLEMSIWFKYFPIKKRFTIGATCYGIATAIGYVVASFGLAFLIPHFGYFALWIIYTPLLIGTFCSIFYLKKLEVKKGLYHHYPYTDEDVKGCDYDYKYDLGEEYDEFKKECEYSKKLISETEKLNESSKFPVDIQLIKKAIVFAKKWHDGQMRKSGEPYYTHPLAVAEMVLHYKFKTHIIAAAILHDVLEDTKCTVELIKEEFSPRIAEIVTLLTRKNQEKKISVGESIKKIFEATDYDALLIKGLDRMHNLQTIGAMNQAKQYDIAKETVYEIADLIPYAVDSLNVNDKRDLERKMEA